MTSPSSALPTSDLIDYATSLGRRLLGGAGTSSLVAYRQDAQRTASMLCHGVTQDGRFLLAGLSDELPDRAAGGFDARIDLTREATIPDVRILAATAHLLGWFVPLTDEEITDEISAGSMPESIRAIATAPGVVVGELRSKRMLLHQGCGVVPLSFDSLLTEHDTIFPAQDEELDAHDVVATIADLRELHADVVTGRIAGRLLSSRPTPEGAHTCGRVHVVDVDAHGLTLMRVGEVTTVAFLPFPEPVRDTTDLSLQLAGLRLQA